MVKTAVFLVALLVSITAPALAQNVTVRVDRNPLHEDETVRLLIRVDGTGDQHSPDLEGLRDAFEVLHTTHSTNLNIINGQTTHATEWIVTLVPKTTGVLTIPSIQVGQAQSKPFQLTILAAAGQDQSGQHAREVFLESSITPKTPYVHSQLVYTIRLFHSIPIQEGHMTDLDIPNAIVKQLGEDVTFDTIRHGHPYHVTERKYAIIPQKRGTLKIPNTVFTGQAVDTQRRRGTWPQWS